MKRSEAVKKLAELFEEHSNNQQYKGYSHEGLADTFLILAKEIGMLPPEQEIPEFRHSAPHEWDKE